MRRGHPLEQTLRFVTGDREYRFEFYAGHSTPSTGLFDQPDQWVGPERDDAAVLLFSGGLDSLAGALSLLSKGGTEVCLVSHQSQPGTKRTQNSLGRALAERFPGKAKHYHFECNLSGVRAAEESQRTRFFLYSSIAFAIAQAYDKQEIFVFENGVTSINYGRRQDLLCARASRTTHPQTVGRMREFLSLVAEKNFGISLPFFWNTKAEILSDLKGSPFTSLISSSVSCSRTFQKLGQATHCGECYQCIDRRIAAYAAGIEDIDHPGLYALDMNNQPFSTGDGRTTAVDYVRQAARSLSEIVLLTEREIGDSSALWTREVRLVADRGRGSWSSPRGRLSPRIKDMDQGGGGSWKIDSRRFVRGM